LSRVPEPVPTRISPFAVYWWLPKSVVVLVGKVRVPVLLMLEITGEVRVKPSTVVVADPRVRVLVPNVIVEFASLALVTLASTIFAVVTVPSVGVRVFVSLVSVPYTTCVLDASPVAGKSFVEAVPNPVICVLARDNSD
jgi:hypothetical protein